jgi:hypothetical protein
MLNNFFNMNLAKQFTTLVLVSIFIAVVAAVLSSFIKRVSPKTIGAKGIEFFGRSDSEKPNDQTSILHHKLFKFFESCQTPGGIELGNTDKAIVLGNYLMLQFSVLYDGLYIFFKNIEKNDFEGLSKLPELYNELIADYTKQSEKMASSTSKGTVCGMPKCAVTKFTRWNRQHTKQLFDDFENALSDRIYQSRRERAFTMATSLFFALRETIHDASHTLPDLNGDFDRELDAMLKEACL